MNRIIYMFACLGISAYTFREEGGSGDIGQEGEEEGGNRGGKRE